jgi:hypothetical protein
LFENENLGNLELLCRFMTESACELLTLETQMFCSVLAKGFQLEELNTRQLVISLLRCSLE